MIQSRIAVAIVVALGVATPAKAGFWGDLKRSFGTAIDNAQRDGAKAIDGVTGGDGEAAAGAPETAEAPVARPLDSTAEPVADGSKQLSKQPGK